MVCDAGYGVHRPHVVSSSDPAGCECQTRGSIRRFSCEQRTSRNLTFFCMLSFAYHFCDLSATSGYSKLETPIGSGTWWFEEVLTIASKCKKDALHTFIAMAADVGSSRLLWNWQELTLCEIGTQHILIRYNCDVIMKNIQTCAIFCSLMTRNLAVDFEANVRGEETAQRSWFENLRFARIDGCLQQIFTPGHQDRR